MNIEFKIRRDHVGDQKRFSEQGLPMDSEAVFHDTAVYIVAAPNAGCYNQAPPIEFTDIETLKAYMDSIRKLEEANRIAKEKADRDWYVANQARATVVDHVEEIGPTTNVH